MSFTDFLFPPCALALVICAYLIPRRFRWVVLLAASLAFYATWGLALIPYALLAVAVSWGAARIIQWRHDACAVELAHGGDLTREEKTAVRRRDRSFCRWVLLVAVLLLLGLLVYVKLPTEFPNPFDPEALPVELPGLPVLVLGPAEGAGVAAGAGAAGAATGAGATVGATTTAAANPAATWLWTLVAPLGISYYTLSLVSYVADVYWRRDQAERNPLRLLLFALYLPKVLEGPIARHKDLAPQLAEPAELSYRNLTRGAQRMAWGYVKKLVIADRLAPFVTAVFAGWEAQHGSLLLLAAICGALQLYCDFSGCMDMALGLSEALGVTLPENFERPFWSRTVAEFWRRWHITLGAWFRDYAYMPLATSPTLIRVSGLLKRVFGAKAGPKVARSFVTVVALLVTWLLTGLWHATGANYLAWGLWWGALITLSTLFGPLLTGLRDGLGIDADGTGWRMFQVLRTFALFVVSRLITIPGDLEATWGIMCRIVEHFGPWRLVDGSIFAFGYTWPQLVALLVAIALLWWVDARQEAGHDVRAEVAALPLPVRWSIYLLLVFAPLIFGAYGTGYNASAFVYMAY